MNYLSACVVANFIRIMTFADAHLAWIQLHKVTMEQFVSVWLYKTEVVALSRCALEFISLLEVLSLSFLIFPQAQTVCFSDWYSRFPTIFSTFPTNP